MPAGVIRVDGAFARGDAVVIRGPDGAEIGRGLVAYDAEDADKIKGRSSADIVSILGFGGRAEMVHRDDMVVGPGMSGQGERGRETRWTLRVLLRRPGEDGGKRWNVRGSSPE